MKLAHFIAIIAFAIAFFLSGTNNYPNAVKAGAEWGFWIALIVGSIFVIISVILVFVGGAAGAAAGYHAGGGIGATFGGLFGIVIVAIPVILGVVSVLLAVFGYHYLGRWADSGLEDKSLMIKSFVLLGLSILLSLFSGSKSSKK